MLNELGCDLLGHILSFASSHRVLSNCARACTQLRSASTRIIRQLYAEESIMWDSIIDKLQIQSHTRCACLGDRDGVHKPRITSVELMKHVLRWDDREPLRNRFIFSHNDKIRMLFFCDCRGCYFENLLPCGRGVSRALSSCEQSHIAKHFHVRWWDDT